MGKSHFFGMLMAATFFMMVLAPCASGMEEKDHIYLYDQYAFPPDKDGGILLVLTYIVPSHETEKGIAAVVESVFKIIAARQDLEKGVKEYMIQILLYPKGTIFYYESTVEELYALIGKISI